MACPLSPRMMKLCPHRTALITCGITVFSYPCKSWNKVLPFFRAATRLLRISSRTAGSEEVYCFSFPRVFTFGIVMGQTFLYVVYSSIVVMIVQIIKIILKYIRKKIQPSGFCPNKPGKSRQFSGQITLCRRTVPCSVQAFLSLGRRARTKTERITPKAKTGL